MLQCPFGSMGPLGFTESLRSLGPAVSQWILASMRSRSAAMLSLVPHCHNGLLVPRGTMVSNMFPSFHESLRSRTGPLVPWGPAVSQWPHHYTRSCSVTMLCMVPQGPAMSQWPLGSVVPCRTQCHSGPLSSTRPCSVTMAPCFPRAMQCHNHHRITQAEYL